MTKMGVQLAAKESTYLITETCFKARIDDRRQHINECNKNVPFYFIFLNILRLSRSRSVRKINDCGDNN